MTREERTAQYRLDNEVKSTRWAMENKLGVTCYVYASEFPEHLAKQGYSNIRSAGYYDRLLNCIVDDNDIPTLIFDERKAPGS